MPKQLLLGDTWFWGGRDERFASIQCQRPVPNAGGLVFNGGSQAARLATPPAQCSTVAGTTTLAPGFDLGWYAEEDLGGVLSEAPAACTWGPNRIDTLLPWREPAPMTRTVLRIDPIPE